MTRKLENWLESYARYTSNSEAPPIMHSWAGVSTIASCLRRKVWIDMRSYKWIPNFYIIFVAKPGVVTKSTTAGLGLDLLREVPGIHIGPDAVTWQALVEVIEGVGESFPWGDEYIPMSAVTLVASELGNLINPLDREQINFYIDVWDGKKAFEKKTKTSGSSSVEAPWVNLLGCTTPHWIADNMPAATVGGGFTSRCIFVYADRKEKLVAYPDEQAVAGYDTLRQDLIQDLNHIATTMVGPFAITEEARVWGRAWYERHWTTSSMNVASDQLDGYMARKQTHLHKLAMVLSASYKDELILTDEDLIIAEQMIASSEKDLEKVFSRIGQTEESRQMLRLVDFIRQRKVVDYQEAYRLVHTIYTDFHEYEAMLQGCINAGYIKLDNVGGKPCLRYVMPEEKRLGLA